ncbi:MAG: hypothetical protein ACTH31_02690 [Pseudoclavibacter sp.]
MPRINSLADAERAIDELVEIVHTLATATPQNHSTLRGTMRVGTGGRVQAGAYAATPSGFHMPYQGGTQSIEGVANGLSSRISNVNNRLQPGGDVSNWITAVSNVANAAHSIGSAAQTAAANAHSRANAAHARADAAHARADAAYSRASTAISNAASAQSTANTANSNAIGALNGITDHRALIAALRSDVNYLLINSGG